MSCFRKLDLYGCCMLVFLDGQENVTIAGNTTLVGLSSGVHNVTVYACDDAGNVGSLETLTFTVAKPEL